jgi:ribosomal protein L37E
MSAAFHHYVCDRCGNYWQAYRAKTCPACKHAALWQFEREQPARDHAAAILDPTRTVRPIA